MAAWTTDIRHLPSDDDEAPAEARRRAAFTREVAEAATSRAVRGSWASAVPCVGVIGGKPCAALVKVSRAPKKKDEVKWACEVCGDSGVVTGFSGGTHDLSKHRRRGKLVPWGIDAGDRALLLEVTVRIPELRAIVSRATPYAELPGLLIVWATVDELDTVYTLVEDLTDGTRSRKRREHYDKLRATLCNSMDGF
jgi:hypothetical protein